MTNAKQRTILRVAAAIMVALFVVQPKATESGYPLGYHLFWATFDNGDGQRAWTSLYPDYRTLAVEYVVLWTVAIALCVAAGEKIQGE